MNDKIVIVANGSLPTNKDLIEKIHRAEVLICCDGAIHKLEQINVIPFAIVGDLDSVRPEVKEKYENIIYHDSNQNTNDLTKAVDWCVGKGFKDITILGATGEREDHTIGNIFLLIRYIEKVNVRMITDYGKFTPIKQSTTFKSYKGQQVSIFAPNPNLKVTTCNLRYPITNQNLPELWNGTLNESLGSNFAIELFGNGGAIVFQNN